MNFLKAWSRSRTPRRLAAGATLALLIGLPGRAPAVVIRADVPQSSYQALANESQFDPVGLIEIYNGKTLLGWGSATLISGNLILSVGHLFDHDAELGATNYYYIIDGQRIPINFRTKGVATVDSGYNPYLLENDISVVELSKTVKHVKPATLDGGSSVLGMVGTFVGFGLHGNGQTGEVATSTPPKSRLAGQNMLDEDTKYAIFADFDSPTDPGLSTMGNSTPLSLEASISHGDSGGGLFVDLNGHWVEAGINDSGDWPFNSEPSGFSIYGYVDGFTRLSTYLSFVESTAKKDHDKISVYTPPKTTSPVIETIAATLYKLSDDESVSLTKNSLLAFNSASTASPLSSVLDSGDPSQGGVASADSATATLGSIDPVPEPALSGLLGGLAMLAGAALCRRRHPWSFPCS